MKTSEAFEGENSSLRKTFDEAVTPDKRVEEILKEIQDRMWTYGQRQHIPGVSIMDMFQNIIEPALTEAQTIIKTLTRE